MLPTAQHPNWVGSMCVSAFLKYSHNAQNKFIYKDEAEEDLEGTAANNSKQEEISQKRSLSD